MVLFQSQILLLPKLVKDVLVLGLPQCYCSILIVSLYLKHFNQNLDHSLLFGFLHFLYNSLLNCADLLMLVCHLVV